MDLLLIPWAVHLPDNLVTMPWWLGGWVLALLLLGLGSWKLEDQDIPKVALISAVFFITTLVHIPIPGGPKTHLLMNGLAGVILGRRAVLAIAPGLFLQAVLFGHGGFLSLGINLSVIGIPALLVGILFNKLAPWFLSSRENTGRVVLITLLNWATLSALALCLVMFQFQFLSGSEEDVFRDSWAWFQDHWLGAWLLPPALFLTLALKKIDSGNIFTLGVIAGEIAVLTTLFGNSMVLYMGGIINWAPLILISCMIQLPLAMVEGIATGLLVSFLHRTRPEILGILQVKSAGGRFQQP